MSFGGPGTLLLTGVPDQVRVQDSWAKPSMALVYSSTGHYFTWNIQVLEEISEGKVGTGIAIPEESGGGRFLPTLSFHFH